MFVYPCMPVFGFLFIVGMLILLSIKHDKMQSNKHPDIYSEEMIERSDKSTDVLEFKLATDTGILHLLLGYKEQVCEWTSQHADPSRHFFIAFNTTSNMYIVVLNAEFKIADIDVLFERLKTENYVAPTTKIVTTSIISLKVSYLTQSGYLTRVTTGSWI